MKKAIRDRITRINQLFQEQGKPISIRNLPKEEINKGEINILEIRSSNIRETVKIAVDSSRWTLPDNKLMDFFCISFACLAGLPEDTVSWQPDENFLIRNALPRLGALDSEADLKEKKVMYFQKEEFLVSFYCVVGKSGHTKRYTEIKQANLMKSGLNAEQLFERAMENLEKSYCVEAIDRYAETEITEDEKEKIAKNMGFFPLILTTKGGHFGAATLFSRKILTEAASRFPDGEKTVIIPSSVHELLMIPYNSQEDLERLHTALVETNRTLDQKRYLSDYLYLWDEELLTRFPQ